VVPPGLQTIQVIAEADVQRILADPASMRMAFQPVVDLRRGVVVGYEALARPTGPPKATPDVWFAAAAEFGLAEELEAVAIRAALAARPTLPANCFLSINVSPVLVGSALVQDALAGDLGGIVLELTEHAPVDDYDALTGDLAPLRAAGVMVAVDDAGSGYAGLAHILALRPHIVKLDRALVAGIDQDEAKGVLVQTLGDFAGQIDAWVLAEGVERPGELDALIRLRVPLAQGYLLARPAEPWVGIDGGLGERIRRRVAANDPEVSGVAVLVEEVPSVEEGEGAALADGADVAVVVNAGGRPVGLLVDDRDEVLAVQTIRPSSSARDVLHRALTRDRRTRFTPLVVVDSTGRYLGVVRLERLIRLVTSG
jgi:EAL domain-containing protein (putative c-di-GMP-specific phosphodiesterase class I)